MSIIVTGGSGFVGSYVTKKLADYGLKIITLDRVECNSNNGKNSSSIKIDVNHLDALEKSMLNCEASSVVHLVGFPDVGECEKNPLLSFQLNTLSTQNVVEAMRKADVENIVFASSASIYGYQSKGSVNENDAPVPNTIYGYHKLLSEQIIESYSERYGIKYVIFRLFNIYGGNPDYGKDVISLFIKKVLNKEPLVLSGPNKFRDFIHINDVAKAFLKACTNNIFNETFNIGSGVKTTLNLLAKIFQSVVYNLEVIKEDAPDDGTGVYADITHAKNLLNFEAEKPLLNIRKHVENCVILKEQLQITK